jgi:cell division protein FtsB
VKLIDKLLKWDKLRVRLKAAEEAGIELAKENGDLRIENIRLKREIERLRGDTE